MSEKWTDDETPLSLDDARAYAAPLGIEPATKPCLHCGKEFTTLIPFDAHGWAGLLAPLHECGERYRLKVMIQSNLKERQQWRKDLKELQKALT